MGDWSRTLRRSMAGWSGGREGAAEDLRDALRREAELEQRRPGIGVLAIGADPAVDQLEDAHAREANAAPLAARHRRARRIAERPLGGGPAPIRDDGLHAPAIVTPLVEHALEHATQSRLPRVRPV